jgi:phage terminase large subunit-like protein
VGLSLLARAAREQGGTDRLLVAVADALEATYRRRKLPVPDRTTLLEEAAKSLVTIWSITARPEQLTPAGDWNVWLVLAGRGWGKTRTGAEFIRDEVASGRARRIALIGPTAADVRDVMVEGQSGILSLYAHLPEDERPVYEPSKRRIVWPNGARATLYSAEKPARLRGPQHDTFWADELAAWQDAQGTWDMLQFGLRLGRKPRGIVTTTPMPIPLVRALMADPTATVTRGSTYDNQANLAPSFIAAIKRAYEGTRLGRQEIHAEILDDNPGALWKTAQLEALRIVNLPQLTRIVVGVDPAASANADSNETGIIAAGVGECWCKGTPETHGFVLDDRTGIYTPAQWASKVAETFGDHSADRVIAEVNQGGDLVESNLRTLGDVNLPLFTVHASRGKLTRAEPIAGLYEQGKIHHVGGLERLENQMTQWNPLTDEKSPDRVDALVWALTFLMLGDQAPAFKAPQHHGTRRIPTPRKRWG